MGVHDSHEIASEAPTIKVNVLFRVLTAAVLVAFATGCSGGSSSGNSTLVMARVKDAVVLDPSHASDGMSLDVDSEVLQGLVAFKPGAFAIVPQLARSWKVSPDGKTWTFELAKDAVFSDGTPLDADAVKFNFDRWRLPNDPNHGNYSYTFYASQFSGFPGVITNVKAAGPTTVVFTLAHPLGMFLQNLAMPSFAIGSPTAIKADPKAFEQKPIGSGPYEVAEWVHDDHITLTANPKYTGVKPTYQTVVIRDIPDQATSVLSLEKGDIDMLTDPRPDDAKTLKAQSGVRLAMQPANNLAYMAMNTEKPPFDKLAVRQAVAYALDIPAIMHGLYDKGTTPGNSWLPDGMMGADAGTTIYPHDVAKAKALLASAGEGNGFTTDLFYPTTPRPYMPEPQRLAETVQAELKAIGVTVKLVPLDFGVFLSRVQNGEQQMCLIGWSGDNGDPDNFMYTLLDRDNTVKPHAQNYSMWKDPKFHRLMMEGQASSDPAERAMIYRQAVKMVHDDVPAIPLVHTGVPVALKTDVDGFIPSPDTTYHLSLVKPGDTKS